MISENKSFINMKMKQILTLSLAFISIGALSKENVPNPNINNVTYNRVAAMCSPSSSQTDMDVNNVRATILGGGDMWWNLDDAQYEILLSLDTFSKNESSMTARRHGSRMPASRA